MILNDNYDTNTMDNKKEILDADQAMEFLKTSRPTFYRWLKAGRIQGFKAGKQWRFYKTDLVLFMESTGTDFVLHKNELNEVIDFFEERLRKKGYLSGTGCPDDDDRASPDGKKRHHTQEHK